MKLSKSDEVAIVIAINAGRTTKALAINYGVSSTHIRKVYRDKTGAGVKRIGNLPQTDKAAIVAALQGAIAHLPVEGSREPCACGRIGCLEAASEQTLTRRALEQGIVDTTDIRTLFEAARDGNDAALELFVDRLDVIRYFVIVTLNFTVG